MKVCTDACLFGAWIAEKLEKKKFTAKKIFDIGCGTGLLSLMLAQKTDAFIDAIEIDSNAFLQAQKNITDSPFKNKVNIFHGSIEAFFANEKYDLIICNPPFYENQLKSNDDAKNMAMHATTLTFSALATVLKNNLSDIGNAAILIPHTRVADFEKELANNQLFINEQLHFSHSPNKKYFRTVLVISSQKNNFPEEEISIKTNTGLYSKEFISLLKDYYLHF
jgi:tRNA1Val (adenine37-N6)-methyltransferase